MLSPISLSWEMPVVDKVIEHLHYKQKRVALAQCRTTVNLSTSSSSSTFAATSLGFYILGEIFAHVTVF